MSTVAEMSAQQAIEFAVRVFLTQGFSATYYSTWREAAEDVGDPIDEDSEWFDFLEESGVWYAFENYTDTSREYLCSGILVKYEGSESSGVAVANESYFVIFSLEDSTGKRYFKRDGFYNS